MALPRCALIKSPSRRAGKPAFRPGFEVGLAGAKRLAGSSALHDVQCAGFGASGECHASLLQYPRLDFFVMHAQQVERAANVVLFSHALGGVALNLRTDSAGYIEPLAQTCERTAKPVQGQLKPSSRAGFAVSNARLR